MAEVELEQDLVRGLLRDQHPDLADLELRDVSGGWDNQQWRLGDELAVRLPRTERAPELLRREQTWLPVLAGRLPLPTPTPVRIGEPSERFEHTWTIVRWVEGEPADLAPVTRREAAEILAGFLRALHHQAPAGNRIQAADRSVAGSPPHSSPKSITPASVPSRTMTLAGCRSPCSQTGAPCHTGAASAASHTSHAAPASGWSAMTANQSLSLIHI